MSEKLSTAELRKLNRNLMFRYFYDAKEAKTKQNVAVDLGLSMPTVTQNLTDLMEAGLIEYTGVMDSTGGRRARTMALVSGARFSIGVELSPKHIRILAVDLKLNELAFERVVCPFGVDMEYRENLVVMLEEFGERHGLDRKNLLGIGITLPGIINEERHIIEIAPVLKVKEMDLNVLTKGTRSPVFVENDASAGGFAECWNRSGQKNMAYLFIGRGVGGAMLINGRSYLGEHGRSAEFGHMKIIPGGEVCNCGRRGCLEAYCSTARLTDDLGIQQIEDFFVGLQGGDEHYAAVWEKYLDHLAIGISNIHTATDCDVLLGGMLAPFLPEHMPALYRRLGELDSFESGGQYFQLGSCGSKANCIGGALHFIDKFIRSV